MAIQKGDSIPDNIVLKYVPLTGEDKSTLTCANPVSYDLSKEAQSKRILIVSFPGAFTPTCSQEHLPDFLEEQNLSEIFSKGYEKVVFLSANDPFVLQAFAKAYKIDQDLFKRDKVIFASDAGAAFSKQLGLSLDLSKMGLGIRTGRYVLAIDHGKVSYIANEDGGEVTVSAFKSAITHL